MKLLKPYNPLVFPGNRLPGFDPSHPATNKCLFSGVSAGANFLSLGTPLVPFKAGTPNGSPTATILGGIGLATSFFGALAKGVTFSFPATVFTAVTMGTIFTSSAISGSNMDIGGNASGAVGFGVFLNASTNQLGAREDSAATLSSIPALVVGVPYFIGVACLSTVGFNFVLSRLDTGQTYSQFVASAQGVSGNAAFTVGNRSDLTRACSGAIACFSYSNIYMSIPQLLAWAADPWAFWYPPAMQQVMFSGLKAPSGGATARPWPPFQLKAA